MRRASEEKTEEFHTSITCLQVDWPLVQCSERMAWISVDATTMKTVDVDIMYVPRDHPQGKEVNININQATRGWIIQELKIPIKMKKM